jgi:hypothetical protein
VSRSLVFSLATAALTLLPGIRTPSHNISCYATNVLRCDIAHADYAAALQSGCITGPSLDWHGFELSATAKGLVECSGGILYDPDTQRPSYVTLAYGKTWRHGAYSCSSRTTGLTCTNRRGHGLFISRQSWRAW